MAKQRLSLRDAAMAAPVTGIKRLNWFEKLDESTRQELVEFVLEWASGGELDERYPSRRSLCRFLATQPFLKNTKRTSLDDKIADIIAERGNG